MLLVGTCERGWYLSTTDCFGKRKKHLPLATNLLLITAVGCSQQNRKQTISNEFCESHPADQTPVTRTAGQKPANRNAGGCKIDSTELKDYMKTLNGTQAHRVRFYFI